MSKLLMFRGYRLNSDLCKIIKINYVNLKHSSFGTEEIPVIRIPKYLNTNLGNAIWKEHKKVKESQKKRTKVDPQHANKLIISSSTNRRINHFYGQHYDSRNVPLFSKEWIKQASVGQKITFHQFSENPSLLDSLDSEHKTFESLGLDKGIVESILRLLNKGDSVKPSSIQFGTIPVILNNKSVIFSGETGSGKTIAYLAPIIQMIAEQKRILPQQNIKKFPLGLVLLPSRELTEQVGSVATVLASSTNVGVATMFGGIPKNISHSGFDLVISTVGLVRSHIDKGIYSLGKLNHIVLDEADTLLDDTFSSEVIELLENLNLQSNSVEEEEKQFLNGTQLICSSATIPTTLDTTVGSLISLNDIEQISTKNLHTLHPNIKHEFYRVGKYERDNKLIELLCEDIKKKKSVIIFANRTNAVNWLFNFLTENDIQCVRLTSEMLEEERFQSFNSFQNGEYNILVTTDLGSRGLDTTRVRHVINFDCPHYSSDYIHRSGRTGRLGCGGGCIVSSFVSYKPDVYMLMELEKSIRLGKKIATDANIKSQIGHRWEDKKNKLSQNYL